MGERKDTAEQDEEVRKYSKYLVIDAGGDGGYRIVGIRSDAPADMIDGFIAWYRDNNRYENGRLRPENAVRKKCIIKV
jgi:hypothetical protein